MPVFTIETRAFTLESEEPGPNPDPGTELGLPEPISLSGGGGTESQLLQKALSLPKFPNIARLLISLLGPKPDASHKSMICSPVRNIKCGLAWPRLTCREDHGNATGRTQTRRTDGLQERSPGKGGITAPPAAAATSLPSAHHLLQGLLRTVTGTGGKEPRKPSKKHFSDDGRSSPEGRERRNGKQTGWVGEGQCSKIFLK